MAGRQRQKITERTTIGPTPGTVDRESGVIRSVRILGSASKNNRQYLPAAMEQAARLYEGCQVFCDHAQGTGDDERSLRDLIGNLRNCRYDASRAEVRGDLFYLKSHPLAEIIAEAAEGFSGCLGLSHVAMATGEQQGGTWVCSEVQQVLSVDLVTRPATNSSLFESVEFGPADDPDAGKAVDPLTGEPIAIPDPKAGLDAQDLDETGSPFLTSLQRSFADAITAIGTSRRLTKDQKREQVNAMLDIYEAVELTDAGTPAAESYRRSGRRYRGLKAYPTDLAEISKRLHRPAISNLPILETSHQQPGKDPYPWLKKYPTSPSGFMDFLDS